MTATDTTWVRVGRVGRPHGLDGAFVVEQASEAPERFVRGARVYVGREPAVVVAARQARGRPVVRLDREVERGAALELPADELPPPAEGSFYAFQLVGLRVEDAAGRTLGTVAEVLPGVANDVLELDSGLAVPLVEDWVLEVDVAGGRVLVADGLVDGA